MTGIPTGTVTFLFTDIEGSTKLWEEFPEAMRVALARHDELLRRAIVAHNGYIFKTVGDAFCAAFPTAPEALAAALDAQRALASEEWPAIFRNPQSALRIRAALHTGGAQERDGDYFGPPVNRVARLLSLGYGEQVLLSLPTYELVRDSLPNGTALRDMGEHRLKDLQRPERVYQLLAPDLPLDFPPLKSLDALPNNLPVQLTSFVGREREMAEVKRLLEGTHLLTLTGAGGSGKTRLSLQVAADLLDAYPDGVWLVELAPLADPNLLPQAVASVLGVREEAARPLLTTLTEHLRSKHLLLVLDNCEHLVEAAARLADALLRACPHLRVLATSREALNIAGEAVYRVPTLGVPDTAQLPPLDALTQYEAVRLFIERAVAARPDFAVDNRNAPAVAQICHRLDGIPLAIELAAARVKAFTAEQIASRLDDRFRLLTGGSRAALPRQQTLRALIDWSHDLLAEGEQILLRRLSVFAGGWTLEAAEKVCAGEGIEEYDVADLLPRLVDKSLVLVEEQGGEMRYGMLETIREYAGEKLREAGESERVRDRYLRFYLALVRSEAMRFGNERVSGLDRLRIEHENIRAAIAWSIEGGDTDSGLQMLIDMWLFYFLSGHFAGARASLEALLEKAVPTATELLARALQTAGNLASGQKDYAAARTFHEQSLSLARALGLKRQISVCLYTLGNIALYQADYTAAHSFYTESLALGREIGDMMRIGAALMALGKVAGEVGDYDHAVAHVEESLRIYRKEARDVGTGEALSTLGELMRLKEDYARARILFEENLEISRRVRHRSAISWTLANLGHVAVYEGNREPARTYFVESIQLFQEKFKDMGDAPGLAACLAGFAGLALLQEQPHRAARLLGAATALLDATNTRHEAADRKEYERYLAATRAQLDEAEFQAAWEEGKGMTMEEAVAYALEETGSAQ